MTILLVLQGLFFLQKTLLEDSGGTQEMLPWHLHTHLFFLMGFKALEEYTCISHLSNQG